MSTNYKRTSDEYYLFINSLINLSDINIKNIESAIISSVVPQNLFALKEFCRSSLNCEPLVIGEDNIDTKIKILETYKGWVGYDGILTKVETKHLDMNLTL